MQPPQEMQEMITSHYESVAARYVYLIGGRYGVAAIAFTPGARPVRYVLAESDY